MRVWLESQRQLSQSFLAMQHWSVDGCCVPMVLSSFPESPHPTSRQVIHKNHPRHSLIISYPPENSESHRGCSVDHSAAFLASKARLAGSTPGPHPSLRPTMPEARRR